MTANEYLYYILNLYKERDLSEYSYLIAQLKVHLRNRAWSCWMEILDSWSRAKWTAIALASDVDYLISLDHNCNENNWWLDAIYKSLYDTLKIYYSNLRKQNVSFRIKLDNLEVDITPARKLAWYRNYHSIYLSKQNTRKQTNIQIHINDISNSGRTNEIKLLKIWRELNNLEFPSIYMEYLVIDILLGKSKSGDALENNFRYLLSELAKDTWNPLNDRIIDPANTNNVLSDLIDEQEKNAIKSQAERDYNKIYLSSIFEKHFPFSL